MNGQPENIMPTETTISPGLRHFLRLAIRGKHRGASSGEKRCRLLAKALLDNCGALDGQAVEGLTEFIRVSIHQPETVRDYLGLLD
jgi:hypothetical protein